MPQASSLSTAMHTGTIPPGPTSSEAPRDHPTWLPLTLYHRHEGRQRVYAAYAIPPLHGHAHVPPLPPLGAPRVADDPVRRGEAGRCWVRAVQQVADHHHRVVQVEGVARRVAVEEGLGGGTGTVRHGGQRRSDEGGRGETACTGSIPTMLDPECSTSGLPPQVMSQGCMVEVTCELHIVKWVGLRRREGLGEEGGKVDGAHYT